MPKIRVLQIHVLQIQSVFYKSNPALFLQYAAETSVQDHIAFPFCFLCMRLSRTEYGAVERGKKLFKDAIKYGIIIAFSRSFNLSDKLMCLGEQVTAFSKVNGFKTEVLPMEDLFPGITNLLVSPCYRNNFQTCSRIFSQWCSFIRRISPFWKWTNDCSERKQLYKITQKRILLHG